MSRSIPWIFENFNIDTAPCVLANIQMMWQKTRVRKKPKNLKKKQMRAIETEYDIKSRPPGET